LQSRNSIQNLSLSDALADCSTVKAIYNSLTRRNAKTCTSLVGDRESLDVFQWLRTTTWQRSGRYDKLVGRDVSTKKTPTQLSNVSNAELESYLSLLDNVLSELKPIADTVANAGTQKGVILLLTCNYGHSDMLINFVCAASKAGLDLSKLLVVATDQETKDLADGLGIAAFYHKQLFHSVPVNASLKFASDHFARIVVSKIYCAALLSILGHSFLLQDVDIVIRDNDNDKDYLEYFVNKAEEEDYDMLFQYDANPRAVYAPWYEQSDQACCTN
jgi:hypothetical protein